MSYVGKGLLHGSYIHNSFSGDGSTVNFTLSTSPGSANALLVMVDNVLQSPSAFSVSGTTLTFTSAPSSGTNNIRVWIMGRELDIGKPAAGTVGATEMENSRLAPSYAKLSYTLPDGTSGGSTTTTTWTVYPLNTENTDADGIVSLSSNQFVLQAGTYKINAFATFFRSNVCQIRLRNITDGTTEIVGSTTYVSTIDDSHSTSHLSDEIVIAAAKTFELQYWCNVGQASIGLGTQAGTAGENEVYGVLEIEKVV